MPENILEIHMQCDEIECGLCGEWTEFRYGVSTYNGDIVSNDFPDTMRREGGGSVAVCERCFERHAAGLIPTYDHYYVRPGPMGVCLVDGAGI